MRIMDVLHWAWASMKVFRSRVQCAALHFIYAFYTFDYVILINVRVNLLTFWLFFIQNVKLSAMHAHSCHWSMSWSISRYAQGCAYSFCVVFSSSFGATWNGIDWATGRKMQKLNAIHIMRRDAGRGKPDAPKQLPLSLGFKCAHCGSEFESRTVMAQHRRNSSFVGTPCADSRNSKSMSFTARGDHSAGILRQNDTLGVLPVPAFFWLRKCSLHLLRIVRIVH